MTRERWGYAAVSLFKREVMQQSVCSNEMENSATSFGWEYRIDPPLACLESLSCFQGEWLSWAAGNVFASYQGIPLYVQPLLPVLRWDPLNLNAEAMLEGLFHQNRCARRKEPGKYLVIQMPAALNWREVVTFYGEEDCLKLNIYDVPKNRTAAVIVWIRGCNRFTAQGPQNFRDRCSLLS